MVEPFSIVELNPTGEEKFPVKPQTMLSDPASVEPPARAAKAALERSMLPTLHDYRVTRECQYARNCLDKSVMSVPLSTAVSTSISDEGIDGRSILHRRKEDFSPTVRRASSVRSLSRVEPLSRSIEVRERSKSSKRESKRTRTLLMATT